MTQLFLGTKQIMAYPSPAPDDVKGDNKPGDPGYIVDYLNGYQSWSPKEVFEAAYLPMGEDSDGSRISEEMVDNFIVSHEVTRMGNHTVVHATLRNGFTIIESSACVDPANYDEKIGTYYAMEKVKKRVWEGLGFLLATARNGI